MNPVFFVGLDVHKESIVLATAPQGDTAVHLYGQFGGTLDALDKSIKKLAKPGVEPRFVYEAGPCGYAIYRHLKTARHPCESIRDRCGRAVSDQRKGCQRLKGFLPRLGHRLPVPCAGQSETTREKAKHKMGASYGWMASRPRAGSP